MNTPEGVVPIVVAEVAFERRIEQSSQIVQKRRREGDRRRSAEHSHGDSLEPMSSMRGSTESVAAPVPQGAWRTQNRLYSTNASAIE